MSKRHFFTLAMVLRLGWPPAGSAAPGSKDKAPTEKDLKEFATKVVTALIK